MIEGGWTYVWVAYALSLSALMALAIVVAWRLAHWAGRARSLERQP